MFSRLDKIPACDRRTDILPQHSQRYAYASRGKNAVECTENSSYLQLYSEFQTDGALVPIDFADLDCAAAICGSGNDLSNNL